MTDLVLTDKELSDMMLRWRVHIDLHRMEIAGAIIQARAAVTLAAEVERLQADNDALRLRLNGVAGECDPDFAKAGQVLPEPYEDGWYLWKTSDGKIDARYLCNGLWGKREYETVTCTDIMRSHMTGPIEKIETMPWPYEEGWYEWVIVNPESKYFFKMFFDRSGHDGRWWSECEDIRGLSHSDLLPLVPSIIGPIRKCE